MSIEDEIFKKAKLDSGKIESSGLKSTSRGWEIKKNLMGGALQCVIEIDKKGAVSGKVFDNGEEYLPFRAENPAGGYSFDVKTEYEEILKEILKKYFIENYFISPQANRITELIYKKFSIAPDFPWKNQKKNISAKDAGVFRKNEGGRWFALLMNIKKDRLITNTKGSVDIINLKLDFDEIRALIQKEGFYPAYHMNKKYWITIALDDTIADEIIMGFITKSYNNVK